MNDTDKQEELHDDDKVIFVPAETIREFESIYDKMKRAREELRKIVEND